MILSQLQITSLHCNWTFKTRKTHHDRTVTKITMYSLISHRPALFSTIKISGLQRTNIWETRIVGLNHFCLLMVNTYRTGGTCCPKSKLSVKSTVIPSVLLWKISQICSVCWHPGEIWTLMKATLRCGTLNIKCWMTLRENWRFSVTATDCSVTSLPWHTNTLITVSTHRGQGSEVTGVRFHGASVEDSDPSPTPSASVINPENTHTGLNICTWKDPHWACLSTCSGYKNKKQYFIGESLFLFGLNDWNSWFVVYSIQLFGV